MDMEEGAMGRVTMTRKVVIVCKERYGEAINREYKHVKVVAVMRWGWS